MNESTAFLYHLGAPSQDVDSLTRSLRNNANLLLECGTMARRPRTYRNAVETALMQLEVGDFTQERRTELSKRLTQGYDLKRFLVSDGSLLAPIMHVFSGGDFYGRAAEYTANLRALFPRNPCEFFLEIRNPIDFIPLVCSLQNELSSEQFYGNVDPEMISWADVVERIQEANPHCKITVWCHEDTPLNWPQVLRAVIGVNTAVPLTSDNLMAEEKLPNAAVERLNSYLTEHPKLSIDQRKTVVSAFLEKTSQVNKGDDFERPTSFERPTGWPSSLLAQISQNYEEDIQVIADLQNVKFLK